MTSPRPSAEKFARAVVSRLNEVVPPHISARADGPLVDVHGERGSRAASGAATIIGEEDDRSLEERLETAARTILNGAQDGIMELLKEQWPVGPNGKAAYSDARVVEGELRMWYGEEDAPVLVLGPLRVDEIFEGAA